MGTPGMSQSSLSPTFSTAMSSQMPITNQYQLMDDNKELEQQLTSLQKCPFHLDNPRGTQEKNF
jgi:hypothetical protein